MQSEIQLLHEIQMEGRCSGVGGESNAHDMTASNNDDDGDGDDDDDDKNNDDDGGDDENNDCDVDDNDDRIVDDESDAVNDDYDNRVNAQGHRDGAPIHQNHPDGQRSSEEAGKGVSAGAEAASSGERFEVGATRLNMDSSESSFAASSDARWVE